MIRTIDQFAKPFDPSTERLEDEEKFAARTDFMNLTDDIFLAHMSEVNVHDKDGLIVNDTSGVSASYNTQIIEQSPEGRYISHLDIMVIDDGDVRKIQIRENDKQGEHRISVYHTSYDSLEVLRDDERHDTQPATETTMPDMITVLNGLQNRVENWSLEVEMGLNNQPVDSEEVTRLRQLLIP